MARNATRKDGQDSRERRPALCWPRSNGSRSELLRGERKIAELEARADIDPLLDIFNRRGFDRELKRSLAYIDRYGTDAALIYLDLDGFKAVNDRHGHAAGDALLRAVAARARPPMCAPPTWWRGLAATNSPCCCGMSSAPQAAKARELEADRALRVDLRAGAA